MTPNRAVSPRWYGALILTEQRPPATALHSASFRQLGVTQRLSRSRWVGTHTSSPQSLSAEQGRSTQVLTIIGAQEQVRSSARHAWVAAHFSSLQTHCCSPDGAGKRPDGHVVASTISGSSQMPISSVMRKQRRPAGHFPRSHGVKLTEPLPPLTMIDGTAEACPPPPLVPALDDATAPAASLPKPPFACAPPAEDD